jgi:transposase
VVLLRSGGVGMFESGVPDPSTRIRHAVQLSTRVPSQSPGSGRSRSVASIAADLEVSDQTIYTWRRQELIDPGAEPGLTSVEAAELAAAKHRIAVLESELAVTRRANELSKEHVASPEGASSRLR